ncbi:MAG: hypothetical protein JSV19_10985 [Phycisphaerales bacterium]|nr:MAG: hypothetical protein JSV19_10985 [Phycisphaerales bacterium]
MSGKSVEQLMARGFELIDDCDFQAAVRIGTQLRKMRHTSAFEILALAHAGMGKTEKAVKILEAGVQKAPTVWVLWQLLGNYRSDLGRHEQAHEAYARALTCPQVNESSVRLNISISLGRQGRYAEALEALDRVRDQDLLLRADSQRMWVLNAQHRYDEVITLGQRCLEDAEGEADPELRAALEARLGQAYWEGHQDRDRALAHAWNALRYCRDDESALWLIREVENRISPKAKYYRLLVEGDWDQTDDEGREMGCIVSFGVVAESPEQALEYVRRFEEATYNMAQRLRIDECDEIEPSPDRPCGVYVVGEYYGLPRGSDE